MTDVFRPAHYLVIKGDLTQPTEAKISASVDTREFKTLRLSGVALGPVGIFESEFVHELSIPVPVPDMADHMGEWVAVAEKDGAEGKEYVVFSDPFGFCPIFYSFLPGTGVIVSDSFAGVMDGAKRFGLQPTLDISHYIATIASANTHFENPSVRRTMAENVHILPSELALYITGTKVELLDRRLLGESAHYDSYEELLQKGVEFAGAALGSVSDSPEIVRTLTLSGGVDSRLVLALIAASGRTSEFNVLSSDPRTWGNRDTTDIIARDIAIADRIRTDFGMAWAQPTSAMQMQFDFHDSLAFHQTFKSNYSFNFAPTAGHTIHDGWTLTLRGGAGEMLRSTTNAQRVGSQIRSGSSVSGRDPRGLVVDWYMKRIKHKAEIADLIRTYMTDVVFAFEGETIEEVMNNQYLQTRNRTHFGHLRQSSTTNNKSIHFLANPYFFAARNFLSFADRSSGRMVRDLFRATVPALLTYPFESDDATRDLAIPPLVEIDRYATEWIREYDHANSLRGELRPAPGWSARERKVVSPYDAKLSSESYLRSAMRVVEGMVDDHEEGSMVRELHQWALTDAERRPARLYPLVAKVASAVDLRWSAGARGVEVGLCAGNLQSFPKLARVRPRQRSVTRDGWSNCAVPDVSVELVLAGGKLSVSIRRTSPPEPYCEFAFYLYRDNRLIEKSWYSAQASRSFEAVPEQGQYRVRMFTRHGHRAEPDYGLASNIVDC